MPRSIRLDRDYQGTERRKDNSFSLLAGFTVIPPDLTLYIIRHGECEHNVAGRAAGQDDSPLTPKGRDQARANGRLLAQLVGLPLDQLRFFCNPLHRTCTTMELLLEEIGLPQNRYRSDRRLMEGDLGDHTGLPGPAMLEHPDYVNSPDLWNYIRPRGESVAMVYDRVGEFLSSLTSDSVNCHTCAARKHDPRTCARSLERGCALRDRQYGHIEDYLWQCDPEVRTFTERDEKFNR